MFNKILKVIEFLIICVMIISIWNVKVFAVGDPVSGNASSVGVKNNTLYYIKNKATGLYLDAIGRGYAGTKVAQWGFHGGDNQKWLIVYRGTGTGRYTIKPAYATDLAMQCNGTPGSLLTLQTAASSVKQNFELRRNIRTSLYSLYIETNDYQSSFIYRLYMTDKINGSEVKLSDTYVTDPDYSEWVLEKAEKGDADFYTRKGGGDIDTTPPNDAFYKLFGQMGYNAFPFVNISGKDAYTFLPDDDIWMFSGHGDPVVAYFDKGGNIVASAKQEGNAIESLPANGLRGLRLMMFFSCNTGVSKSVSGKVYNIVDEAFNKGAQFAFAPLQFTGTTYDDNWINTFNISLANGKTVGEAINAADIVSPESSYHYYRGNTYQKLTY